MLAGSPISHPPLPAAQTSPSPHLPRAACCTRAYVMAPPLACRQRPDAGAVTSSRGARPGRVSVDCASSPTNSSAVWCLSGVLAAALRPACVVRPEDALARAASQSEDLIAAPRLFCERCGVAIRLPTVPHGGCIVQPWLPVIVACCVLPGAGFFTFAPSSGSFRALGSQDFSEGEGGESCPCGYWPSGVLSLSALCAISYPSKSAPPRCSLNQA